ncbi:hypothetical protein F5B20DRAFT_592508 [Whalleya microplaca]|nr:hypothetical protein F5B20DRAFT_592508 [Whalleya microplaca]
MDNNSDRLSPTDNLFSELEKHLRPGNGLFGHHRRLVEVPNAPKKQGSLGFEYAEHGFLGDNIELQWIDGKGHLASEVPLKLPNELSLTYGQINGLAGDFYGTTKPISDGATLIEQMQRFTQAWHSLAGDTSRQPCEAHMILEILLQEVNAVNKALEEGKDPSKAYATLQDQTITFQELTWTRAQDYPSYLGLSLINWDHFGEDARSAYNAGHLAALTQAAKGTPDDLRLGYAMNAFADHFLEDSFSAGHVRTPRKLLHDYSFKSPFPDLCAKYMHDEDNAIGLSVRDPSGSSWTMYGDKRLLDEVDAENNQRCSKAVQTSADEVWTAWKTKSVPEIDSFGAWKIACTLESARGVQALTPLFKFGEGPPRRSDINNRRDTKFTTDYWFASTAAACLTSGLWKYPITLNTLPKEDVADDEPSV